MKKPAPTLSADLFAEPKTATSPVLTLTIQNAAIYFACLRGSHNGEFPAPLSHGSAGEHFTSERLEWRWGSDCRDNTNITLEKNGTVVAAFALNGRTDPHAPLISDAQIVALWTRIDAALEAA